MYLTIIYWDGENRVRPILNIDNTLALFDNVNKADEYAGFVETISNQMCRPVETRVISIEGVTE